MKKLRTRQFHILIISIFSILSLSALIHGQRPKPEPTSPASQQINEAKERKRKNDENIGLINSRMATLFTRSQNVGKLPFKTFLYLIIQENEPVLIRLADFQWVSSGDERKSTFEEEVNGLNWEWAGEASVAFRGHWKWDERAGQWGKYFDNPSQSAKCRTSFSKQKGKDLEMSPLKCNLYGSYDSYSSLWGKSTSIKDSDVSELENRQIEFGDFLVKAKIKQGDTDLAEGKNIADQVVNRIFNKCSDEKYYTSSVEGNLMASYGDREFNQFPDSEIWTIHQFEGFKYSFDYKYKLRLLSVSHRNYGYGGAFFKQGWSRTHDENLLSDIQLVKDGNDWFVIPLRGVASYMPNNIREPWDRKWFLKQSNTLLNLFKSGKSLSLWPLVPTPCLIADRITKDSTILADRDME